jgi:hypothetical protein
MTTKTILGKVQDWAAKLAGARTAVDDLHSVEKELRQEAEGLAVERTRLLGARPPREDLIALAERQVDAIAAEWANGNGPQIVAALAGAVDVQPGGDAVRGLVPGDIRTWLPGMIDGSAVIGLVPSVVKNRLRQIIEAADYIPGPSMDQRQRMIAELDVKLADVESRHSELVDHACELGITLELLPNVAGQRARKAQAHQRWELDVRANAALYRRSPALKPPEPES